MRITMPTVVHVPPEQLGLCGRCARAPVHRLPHPRCLCSLPSMPCPCLSGSFSMGPAAALQALDNQGAADFWYSSGFISRDTYDGLLKHCNFSATGEPHRRASLRLLVHVPAQALATTAPCGKAADPCRSQLGCGPQDSRGPKVQLWASAAFPSPVPPPTPWLAAVLWRTEGESGVTGECAKYRDTAHKEAQGYSLYGVNAPACKPGPDGKPAEEQPDWPSECAGLGAGCCAGDAAAQLPGLPRASDAGRSQPCTLCGLLCVSPRCGTSRPRPAQARPTRCLTPAPRRGWEPGSTARTCRRRSMPSRCVAGPIVCAADCLPCVQGKPALCAAQACTWCTHRSAPLKRTRLIVGHSSA